MSLGHALSASGRGGLDPAGRIACFLFYLLLLFNGVMSRANSHSALAPIDWITFDCYGTLIDWEAGMREAFSPILKARGLQAGLDDLAAKYIQSEMWVERHGYQPYRRVMADSAAMLFKQHFQVDLNEEESGALLRTFPDWRPFSEVPGVLERLKKRYRLAILSNIDDDLLGISIKRLGVPFDAVVTAEQVKSYKPVNTHWKEALSRFNITEEQIFHVAGSYLHDVMPAKQLGIACAWINRKNEKPFVTSRPDAEFTDLTRLPEFLGA